MTPGERKIGVRFMLVGGTVLLLGVLFGIVGLLAGGTRWALEALGRP